MPDLHNIKDLFERYLIGSCTYKEVEQLMQLFGEDDREELNQLVLIELERQDEKNDEDYQANIDRVYSRINDQLHPVKITRRLWPKIAVAASILILLGAGTFLAIRQNRKIVYTADVKPFTQETTLKTGNGKRFILSKVGNGIVFQQGQTTVHKTAGQQIAYNYSNTNTVPIYDTIEVPAGGRPQQVILSDGSKVLLNTATILRFPENLNSSKVNQLKLISGEIYCDIIHNPKAPLTIITPSQVTEDIGTQFDISAYPDETIAQVMLIQGAIKVSSGGQSKLLTPGEQALTTNGQITLQKGNIDEILAWKNGYFRFNGEQLSTIMRQLSRWYNIDVVYKGAITNSGFYGKISRSKNISEVLQMLEKTKTVHFEMQGRRVIIIP